jgi:cytochrome c-type biogenesis protein CcmH/NrfG
MWEIYATDDHKDAIEAMEAMMSSESAQRARMKAEQEILAIKLGQWRQCRPLDSFSKLI